MYRSRLALFLLLLASTFALGLSACASPAAPTTVSDAAPAATQVAAQPEGCLGSADQALVDLKCQEVKIAVENAYLPFNYIESKTGKPGGWDYDVWNEICTRLHCVPQFTEAGWDGLIQGTSEGQYDVAADGITVTEERKNIVDFSKGYIKIQQRLLVRQGETRFKSIEDFAKDEKLVLGTQSNTTNYETSIKYLPETRVKAFEQFPFAVQSLLAGDVDAVMIDQVAGMGYMGTNAEKLEFVGDPISSDELGFAFPKGSALVDPINKAIDAMQTDGFLEKVNIKYFGPDFKVSADDIVTSTPAPTATPGN